MSRANSPYARNPFRRRFERECRPDFECNDPYAYTQRVLLTPDHTLHVRRHSIADGLLYAFIPIGDTRWVTIPGKPFILCLMSNDQPLFNVELLNISVNVNWLDNDRKLILKITNRHHLTYLQNEAAPLGINFSPDYAAFQPRPPYKIPGKLNNHLEIVIIVILSLLSLHQVNMRVSSKSNVTDNKSMFFPLFIECIAAFVFYSVCSVYTEKPSLNEIHKVVKNCVAAVFTGLNILVIKDAIFQPEVDYMLLTLQHIILATALKISALNWED